jgi:hypothetical protein
MSPTGVQQQKEWQRKVEDHSIPWLRRQDGLISFFPGMPMEDQ